MMDDILHKLKQLEMFYDITIYLELYSDGSGAFVNNDTREDLIVFGDLEMMNEQMNEIIARLN